MISCILTNLLCILVDRWMGACGYGAAVRDLTCCDRLELAGRSSLSLLVDMIPFMVTIRTLDEMMMTMMIF